jgi:protocatechuate 3,4-dioxygenase beta subunit
MNENNASHLRTSRRNMLRIGATSAAATFFTGKITQGAIVTTPTETQGPYWIDEGLNRSDIRSHTDGTLTQAGLPLYLTVNVSVLSGGVASPLTSAYVDIWHCNALGAYSDEPAGMGNPNTSGQKWLRGYQITNSRGVVYFTTIYPGFYTGRCTHIHARVRTYSGTTTTRNMTTQFFFDDAVSDQVFLTSPYSSSTNTRTRNSTDMVYNTVSTGSTVASPDGSRLLLRMSNNGNSAIASFNIIVA